MERFLHLHGSATSAKHHPYQSQRQRRRRRRKPISVVLQIVVSLLFFVGWGLVVLFYLFFNDAVTNTSNILSVTNLLRRKPEQEPLEIVHSTEDVDFPWTNDVPAVDEVPLAKAAAAAACPSYGCPRYPPEINAIAVNQTIDSIHAGTTVHERSLVESTFASKSFATLTRQSNQHEFNQDRSVIIQPFITNQSPSTGGQIRQRQQNSFLVAIFDGHGVLGHRLAEYVVHTLPERLAHKLNAEPCCRDDAWIAKQLKDTFIEINDEAPSESALRGGCTASVSLRLGNKLFVANAGDSRTILVKYSHVMEDWHPVVVEGEPFSESFGNWSTGTTTIENGLVHEIPFMTRKDKANLPDEKARIEAMGGKIHIPHPPRNPNLSRVIVFSKAAKPVPQSIGLAMSRSIGDAEWTAVGVTPEPIVNVLSLENYYDIMDRDDPSLLLLIAASDGIWDLQTPQFYAKRFRAAFYPTATDVRHPHPLETLVNTLYQVAPPTAPWYRDDMSLITLQITT